jgi:hypothetical protein
MEETDRRLEVSPCGVISGLSDNIWRVIVYYMYAYQGEFSVW